MAKEKKIPLKDIMNEPEFIDVEFKDIQELLKKQGIEAKNKQKSLTQAEYEKLKEDLLAFKKVGKVEEKEGGKEKYVQVGVKRRIKEKAQEELEEQIPVKGPEEVLIKEDIQKEQEKEEVVKQVVKEAETVLGHIVEEKKVEEPKIQVEEKVEKKEVEIVKEEVVKEVEEEKEKQLSPEENERVAKELEYSMASSAIQETKPQRPIDFQRKEKTFDRKQQERKDYQHPRKDFKRDKFDKQVKEKERTIAPGKREIIMGPKDVKTPPEVPVEQKGERRKGFDKKKEVLKKDQLLELKEREDKLVLQKKKKEEETVVEKPAVKKPLKIAEAISVGELAKRMGVKTAQVIKTFLDLGMMVTINHIIDSDTAAIVASEFGYEVEKVSIDAEDLIAEEHAEKGEEKKLPRPPVVTIMGHVDHGKTSLLDAIRKTNVVATEAGGITQHIGAYQVEVGKGTITFLDTPGHEAFTAMRARGAQVTDIVILVVAADEGPMPQTIEALNHAKAANVPIIVAINKIDKPGANPEKVKSQLAEKGLIPEEWGGTTLYAEVSAKMGKGIQELLDLILIQAEVMELKANPDKLAKGVVIESKLDKGRGPVATILVQEGTLKVGDPFIVGTYYGRVRSLINDKGKKLEKAGPATPVEVLGLPGVPDAGEHFIVVSDERKARQIASLREAKLKEKEMAKKAKLSLEEIYERIQQGEIQELNIVLKADVQGSVEAVSEALKRVSTEKVKVNIIHSGVGSISESDVMLAEASKAIIIGFNVKTDLKAQQLAEKNNVDIKIYNIIYDLVDNVKLALEGLLKPVIQEFLVGKAEVRQTFYVSKVGTIAGSYVLEGRVMRNDKVKLLRDKKIIFEGKISSLKRFKDDVREVQQGFECGISLDGWNDIKIGDIMEFYEIRQIAVKLDDLNKG
ncbi:MAG: translation initiation factor IF-2 [Proteobacteria bacterium]|nr:translation initiation factor IF-2 [Pseudomonadota bacterium]